MVFVISINKEINYLVNLHPTIKMDTRWHSELKIWQRREHRSQLEPAFGSVETKLSASNETRWTKPSSQLGFQCSSSLIIFYSHWSVRGTAVRNRLLASPLTHAIQIGHDWSLFAGKKARLCVLGASGRDSTSHWEAVKMFEWNSEHREKQAKTENKVDTLAHGGTLDLLSPPCSGLINLMWGLHSNSLPRAAEEVFIRQPPPPLSHLLQGGKNIKDAGEKTAAVIVVWAVRLRTICSALFLARRWTRWSALRGASASSFTYQPGGSWRKKINLFINPLLRPSVFTSRSLRARFFALMNERFSEALREEGILSRRCNF